MSLADDLVRAAGLAEAHARPGDAVSAVIASEPTRGERLYLVAFDDADGYRSWLAIGDDGEAVTRRDQLRAAISISVMCELAGDAAGGGDLDTLIARLGELRETDAPAGIEAAEEAARALRDVLAEPPQLATPERLDAIGQATRLLERELDPTGASPFASAMRASQDAVAELQREIEAGYRVPLD